MAETAIMAEEMQSPKKVAFANKPYTQEERIKREEEELEQLIKEQNGEVEEPVLEEEAEPANAEERTFKKRYSDLRRHQQKQAEELKKEIDELKRQLSTAAQKEMKLPKSDEDIEEWAKEYPDVAQIVETIAMKKAAEQASVLEDRMKAIDEMQQSASKEKAEAELIRLHPDFSEIRDSDDFHDWADEQPKWVQDALYENSDDPASVVRVIDLYKSDKGMTKSAKKIKSKEAASVVNKRSKTSIDASESEGTIKESDVAKMSDKAFEKNQEEITQAMRSGKFIYDISGKAR